MPVIIDWTTSLDSSSERPEVLARFVHNPKYLRYATVHIAFISGAGSGYLVGVLSDMRVTLSLPVPGSRAFRKFLCARRVRDDT